MKEISRRAMSSGSEGAACGPESMYAVDAEIVVEDEGNKIYLHTQWVDAADEILFEASTESLYDCYKRLNTLTGEDMDAFCKECENRDRIGEEADIGKILGPVDIYERYAEQYQQLVRMMQDVLDKDGVDADLSDPEDEDEE